MGEHAACGHEQAGKCVRTVHRHRAVGDDDVRPFIIRVVCIDCRVIGKGRRECREAGQN